MRDDGRPTTDDASRIEGQPLRKPILLAASILAAVTILLVVLFAALNPGSSSKGSASAVGVTPTIPADATSIAAVFPNPGFEDGFTGWTRGYMRSDGTVLPNSDVYTVDIDHSVAHSGSASATIALTDTERSHGPQAWVDISTRVRADIFRGKRIRYSAYLRTQSNSVGAKLWMNVPGTIEGKPTDPELPLSWDNTGYGIRLVLGTTDWRNEAIVLDVPQEANFLVFGVETGNYGQTWMDDVQIEVVGPDVPSTDKAGKKQLDNLDFEQGLTDWVTGTDKIGQTAVGTAAEMAHTGKSGAYVRHIGAETPTQGGLAYALIYGQYYRDKRVRVSAFMNVDKAPKGAALELWAFYLESNNSYPLTITNSVQLSPTESGTAGWQKVEVVIDVPHRASDLDFAVSVNGDGEVWIDDVQIDVLGPAPTPTQTPR